jgi:hypothetical protein
MNPSNDRDGDDMTSAPTSDVDKLTSLSIPWHMAFRTFESSRGYFVLCDNFIALMPRLSFN